MSSITAKLKAARGAWRSAKAPEGGGFTNLDDGKYQVEIAVAELKEDKNGGVGIQWKFITDEGATQSKWSAILDAEGDPVPEDRLKWVKAELTTLLGQEVDDLTELEELLADLVGKSTEIIVKTKGEYVNVYLNDEATGGGVKAVEDEEEEDEDDDEDEDGDEDEKPAPKKKKKVVVEDEDEDAEEEGEGDEDDDEDEDEAEVRRLLKAKKPAAKKRK